MEKKLLNRCKKKVAAEFEMSGGFVLVSRLGDLFTLGASMAGKVMSELASEYGFVRGYIRSKRVWFASECHKEESMKKSMKARSERISRRNREVDEKIGELIFLSKKRPKGLNTIFDECRENSQIHQVNLLIQQAKKITSVEGMAQVKQK